MSEESIDPNALMAEALAKKEELEKKQFALQQQQQWIPSVTRASTKHEDAAVPLWLITFTDVMALMLTFFVLLYAMSVPQEDKWEELKDALNDRIGRVARPSFNSGTQDVIAIDRVNQSRALDLRYVKTIISKALDDRGVKNIIFIQDSDRLTLSLPSELFFDVGSADVHVTGKKVLFTLGGVLSRIKNRIEVVGNTDPQPIASGKGIYRTNWELSLARSAAVSAILRDVGYKDPITIRGLSSARYDELPEEMDEQKKFDLSRRVDIIVMEDDGYKMGLFQ